jgi:hypothetical protein
VLSLLAAPKLGRTGALGTFVDIVKDPGAAFRCLLSGTIQRTWIYYQALQKALKGDTTDSIIGVDGAPVSLEQVVEEQIEAATVAGVNLSGEEPPVGPLTGSGGSLLQRILSQTQAKAAAMLKMTVDVVKEWWEECQKLHIIAPGFPPLGLDDNGMPTEGIPPSFVEAMLGKSLNYEIGASLTLTYIDSDTRVRTTSRMTWRLVREALNWCRLEIMGGDIE